MTMVYCRGCGKEIHETAPTCPQCGFVQFSQTTHQGNASVTDSMWMAVTAFVCAVLSFLNWMEIEHWSKDVKIGLWMFSIVSMVLGITTLQQNRKGKVIAGISIVVSALTILILIDKM